jgi:hypothetical protein
LEGVRRGADADGFPERFWVRSSDARRDFGIIVGDIAHNLRSSLDHLVWQLVLQNRRLPSRRNQFPIMVTSRAWDEIIERKPSPPGDKKLPSRKYLKGVGERTRPS